MQTHSEFALLSFCYFSKRLKKSLTFMTRNVAQGLRLLGGFQTVWCSSPTNNELPLLGPYLHQECCIMADPNFLTRWEAKILFAL